MRLQVKQIKEAMLKGCSNGIKELKTAGIKEENLCPICFTNEIEGDLSVDIILDDPKTVQFSREARYCTQCTLKMFKDMIYSSHGRIYAPFCGSAMSED